VDPKRLDHQRWPAALGVPYGHVRLATAAGDEWARAYDRVAATLRESLGDACAGIEHVGSTAVPGMPAKPIIDMAVGMRPAAMSAAELRTRMERCGLIHRGDKGSQGGVLFVLEGAPGYRLAHVHAVTHGDESWVRYVAFRDRRIDPATRAAYTALKQRLAERFPENRAAYTAGKERFIAATLAG
jgi:GrpB-like predicted nucleotidyltransferase (UPF0157 family)